MKAPHSEQFTNRPPLLSFVTNATDSHIGQQNNPEGCRLIGCASPFIAYIPLYMYQAEEHHIEGNLQIGYCPLHRTLHRCHIEDICTRDYSGTERGLTRDCFCFLFFRVRVKKVRYVVVVLLFVMFVTVTVIVTVTVSISFGTVRGLSGD